MPARLVANE